MGQELLTRGVKPKGTLWSSAALLEPGLQPLVKQAHVDFIEAGADAIVSFNFAIRKKRMEENNCQDLYLDANRTAGRLAKEAVQSSGKKIAILGSLPPQNLTYSPIIPDKRETLENFRSQALCLDEFVDCFYLDVLASSLECNLALEAIADLAKPVLLGLHIRDSLSLPSGESLSQAVANLKTKLPILGLIAACVAPETVLKLLPEMQQTGLAFGAKINAFAKIPDGWQPQTDTSPSESLGIREDFSPQAFAQVCAQLQSSGATILGGCCQVSTQHIAAISHLKSTFF